MKNSVLIFTAIIGAAIISPAIAQTSLSTTSESELVQQTEFVKKRYTIQGKGELVKSGEISIINFSEDFKTKSGPDLKVYLSPKPLSELNGKNALQNAVKVGVLKSNAGPQSYIIPDNIDVSGFQSVIIQCEAFSVLWGGFDLPVTQ